LFQRIEILFPGLFRHRHQRAVARYFHHRFVEPRTVKISFSNDQTFGVYLHSLDLGPIEKSRLPVAGCSANSHQADADLRTDVSAPDLPYKDGLLVGVELFLDDENPMPG